MHETTKSAFLGLPDCALVLAGVLGFVATAALNLTFDQAMLLLLPVVLLMVVGYLLLQQSTR